MALALEQKEFLSRKECAQYLATLGLPLKPKTLENLAANNNAGGGPPFTRVRWARTFYKRTDVEMWVKSQTRRIA